MTAVPAHSIPLGGDGHGGGRGDRDELLDRTLDRVQRPALLAAAAGVVLLVAGILLHGSRAFFQAYLYGYLFWTGIALGCFSILMLAHLVGGTWGAVIRRPLESGARLLPLMALLFVPVALGMWFNKLYEWTDPPWRAAHDAPLMAFKLAWLSPTGFVIRAAIYFAVWILLAMIINRRGDEQDRTGDPTIFRRLQQISGPGIVLYVGTVTLAEVDWAMSLDADWLSTIWGLYFVVSQALGTMALVIALLALLSERRPFAGVVTIPIFHDLGNLLMAFVMLWAYISFSQFLLIWQANLAEEVPFYVARTHAGWKYVALFVILFHFFVPFLLLLWRRTKRNVRPLAVLAGWIVAMRLVDLFWVVAPSFGRGVSGHGGDAVAEAAAGGHAPADALSWWHAWMYPAAAAAIGGLFVCAFVWQLRRRPLLPLHDPRLEAHAANLADAAGGHH
jgi:hypothetical protein